VLTDAVGLVEKVIAAASISAKVNKLGSSID